MKWNMLVMCIGLLAMVSCGGSKKEEEKKEGEKAKTAADINVKDLKETCDYADALLIVKEELKGVLDKNKDVKEEDISEETRLRIADLDIKAMEIQTAMDKNDVNMMELIDCPAYKKVESIKLEIAAMIEKKFNSDTNAEGDEALKDLEAEMGEEIETIPR